MTVNWGLYEVEAMNSDRYPIITIGQQEIEDLRREEQQSIRQRVAQALVQLGFKVDATAADAMVDDLR